LAAATSAARYVDYLRRIARWNGCRPGETIRARDGFGKQPRNNSHPEAAALVEVLKALRMHPAVAWTERMNTGACRGESNDVSAIESTIFTDQYARKDGTK
jgi:hypothetical protein